jgi:hypothetical protein
MQDCREPQQQGGPSIEIDLALHSDIFLNEETIGRATEQLRAWFNLLSGDEGSERQEYRTRRAPGAAICELIYERLTDADDNTFPRSLFMLLKSARDQELTYEHATNIQHPRDRLLRSASLNAGLKEASRECCDALRQEYDDLKDAFAFFDRLNGTFNREDFTNIYMNKPWKADDLLDNLKRIGVISEKEPDSFKFAYIYLDGFGIKRRSKI